MSFRTLITKRKITKSLQRKADAIVKHVILQVNPLAVYLVGSFLTGTVHANSDLDLVVVVPSPLKRESLALLVHPSRPHKDVPVDIHFVDEARFHEFMNVGGISFTAKQHGKLLFQRNFHDA